MAIMFDAPVTPDALTAFLRVTPLPSELKLSGMFPAETTERNVVDWSEITRTNRTARFRTYDGRIHVSDRDAYSDKQVRMLPLSDSLNMGEYERLQLQFLQTGGTRTSALANAIYNDGERLLSNARNRVEQAIADVLVDGEFSPAELPGLEADFDVPAGHKITVGTAWTTAATADPISDLIAACDVYEATNGFRPGFVITSRRVRRLFEAATKTINAVKGAQTGVTRVAMADAFGIFDTEGIPTDWTTYETQLDVDGVTTRLIPDDKIILGPPNRSDLLAVKWGLSATALELVQSNEAEMSFADAPGLVGVVEKVGPPYRQFTFIDGVCLPYLKDGRKLMVLDVA